MAEEIAKAENAKTITIDVNEESYNQGYSDAYAGCSKNSDLYLGHTSTYWTDLAVSWFPFSVFIFVFCILLLRGTKQQKSYMDKYNVSMDRQQKALEIMEQTNKLLAEISHKLNNK